MRLRIFSLAVILALSVAMTGCNSTSANRSVSSASQGKSSQVAGASVPPEVVPAGGNSGAAEHAPTYSTAQLEHMVAPIALYPDALLSQIMMASTYPLELVEADRWERAHGSESAAARQQALAGEKWDPSVTSLTNFPKVLHFMSQHLDWSEALGEAFLAQKAALMAAIQQMRADAAKVGNLRSSPQLAVTTQDNDIEIAPADPSVYYVPYYDPNTIYGPDWDTSDWYWSGISDGVPGWLPTLAIYFGPGCDCGPCMFGGCNWQDGSVWVNVNYWSWPGYQGGVAYNNVYGNPPDPGGRVGWRFNPAHRGGVAFHNPTLRGQYGNAVTGTRGERGTSVTTAGTRGEPGAAHGATSHEAAARATAHEAASHGATFHEAASHGATAHEAAARATAHEAAAHGAVAHHFAEPGTGAHDRSAHNGTARAVAPHHAAARSVTTHNAAAHARVRHVATARPAPVRRAPVRAAAPVRRAPATRAAPMRSAVHAAPVRRSAPVHAAPAARAPARAPTHAAARPTQEKR